MAASADLEAGLHSSTSAPTRPTQAPPRPRVKGDPQWGNQGHDFEECEHLVSDEDPDTALCGVDQTGVPWDQGWPLCQACLAVAQNRMS